MKRKLAELTVECADWSQNPAASDYGYAYTAVYDNGEVITGKIRCVDNYGRSQNASLQDAISIACSEIGARPKRKEFKITTGAAIWKKSN